MSTGSNQLPQVKSVLITDARRLGAILDSRIRAQTSAAHTVSNSSLGLGLLSAPREKLRSLRDEPLRPSRGSLSVDAIVAERHTAMENYAKADLGHELNQRLEQLGTELRDATHRPRWPWSRRPTSASLAEALNRYSNDVDRLVTPYQTQTEEWGRQTPESLAWLRYNDQTPPEPPDPRIEALINHLPGEYAEAAKNDWDAIRLRMVAEAKRNIATTLGIELTDSGFTTPNHIDRRRVDQLPTPTVDLRSSADRAAEVLKQLDNALQIALADEHNAALQRMAPQVLEERRELLVHAIAEGASEPGLVFFFDSNGHVIDREGLTLEHLTTMTTNAERIQIGPLQRPGARVAESPVQDLYMLARESIDKDGVGL